MPFLKSLDFELSCNCSQLVCNLQSAALKDQDFISMLITIGRNYPNESKVNPFQQTLELSSHVIELLWILYIIPERTLV